MSEYFSDASFDGDLYREEDLWGLTDKEFVEGLRIDDYAKISHRETHKYKVLEYKEMFPLFQRLAEADIEWLFSEAEEDISDTDSWEQHTYYQKRFIAKKAYIALHRYLEIHRDEKTLADFRQQYASIHREEELDSRDKINHYLAYIQVNSLKLPDNWDQTQVCAGLDEIREYLILSNTGLVVEVAKSFVDGRDFDEVTQPGYIGLIKAVDQFDYTRGCVFSTFAVPKIRTEIFKHIIEEDSIVSVPLAERKSGGLVHTLSRLRTRLMQELHKNPTFDELVFAALIAMDKDPDEISSKEHYEFRQDVQSALGVMSGILSFDVQIASGNPQSDELGDRVPDEDADRAYKNVENEESLQILDKVLTPRQQRVLELDHLKYSYVDISRIIAEEENLPKVPTREAIRQSVEAAKNKAHHYLAHQKIREGFPDQSDIATYIQKHLKEVEENLVFIPDLKELLTDPNHWWWNDENQSLLFLSNEIVSWFGMMARSANSQVDKYKKKGHHDEFIPAEGAVRYTSGDKPNPNTLALQLPGVIDLVTYLADKGYQLQRKID